MIKVGLARVGLSMKIMHLPLLNKLSLKGSAMADATVLTGS
jgi:hypothetical protein